MVLGSKGGLPLQHVSGLDILLVNKPARFSQPHLAGLSGFLVENLPQRFGTLLVQGYLAHKKTPTPLGPP